MSEPLPPPITPPADPNEEVAATVVDAVAGTPLRVIRCPRHALRLQAGAGEEIVERILPLGKRWDRAAGAEADADPPPAPPGTGVQWDAARWRWVPWEDRNREGLRRIEALERAQLRALREIALGVDTAANRAKLQAIDNAIVALRDQFQP